MYNSFTITSTHDEEYLLKTILSQDNRRVLKVPITSNYITQPVVSSFGILNTVNQNMLLWCNDIELCTLTGDSFMINVSDFTTISKLELIPTFKTLVHEQYIDDLGERVGKWNIQNPDNDAEIIADITKDQFIEYIIDKKINPDISMLIVWE